MKKLISFLLSFHFLVMSAMAAEKQRGLCFSMITTEPNAFIAPVHDRLLKILRPDEFRPYLDGEIKEFEPAEVPLKFEATENFLTRKQNAPSPQGELFEEGVTDGFRAVFHQRLR